MRSSPPASVRTSPPSPTTACQIPFGIVAKETDAAKRDDFVRIIDDTLADLVKNGIDKDLLTAAVNKMEYALREAEGYTTRGIIYYINAFETWLYDGDPFDALCYNDTLRVLREGIASDYYERYIQSRILDNPHKGHPDSAANAWLQRRPRRRRRR